MAADRDHRSPAPARAAWVALAVTALVIIVYGGYGHHWSWTGINGRTATLWDWLHLLLLPFAAVLLPLWLRHGARLGPALELALAGVGAAFVVVVAGYTTPWAWTGFTGNSLWDWLHLLLLPLLVPVLVPILTPRVMTRMGIEEEKTAAGEAAEPVPSPPSATPG